MATSLVNYDYGFVFEKQKDEKLQEFLICILMHTKFPFQRDLALPLIHFQRSLASLG